MDELIKQRLTTNGTNRYYFNYDDLYKLLSKIWQPQLPGETLQERVDRFVKNPTTGRWDEQNQYFYFDGSPLGHGSEYEFNQMKTELFNIVSNSDLLAKINNIQDSEAELRSRIGEIQRLIDPIIKLIDQGLYETKIKKCCPTLWSLIKKYR